MKSTIIALCLMASAVLNTKAQQSVKLAFKYLPQHKYSSKFSMNVNGTVNIQGNSAIADSIKAKGLSQNAKLSVNTTGTASIQTGAEGGGLTPVIMRLESISAQPQLNGQPIPLPAGMLQGKAVYAKASADGKLQIDSVSGRHLPDSVLTRINNMMSMAMSRMQLPDKTFKPGDTYTQEVPLYIPMKGMSQAANAKTRVTYKLVRVNGNEAYFDLSQTTSFSDTKQGTTTTINGTGTGTMVYEVAEHYPSSYQSTSKIKVHAVSGVKGGADAAFTINTTAMTSLLP